jgi:hypothetical protein
MHTTLRINFDPWRLAASAVCSSPDAIEGCGQRQNKHRRLRLVQHAASAAAGLRRRTDAELVGGEQYPLNAHDNDYNNTGCCDMPIVADAAGFRRSR